MSLPSVMTSISPDVFMRTLTGQCPVRLLPVAYTPRSGFMPSGSLVNSVQSLPGLVPFHTSQRTYTMPPIRRAWQSVVSDSQMFTQPVLQLAGIRNISRWASISSTSSTSLTWVLAS